MEEVSELHAVIKGSVQGVGFRFTTKQHAQSLGLKGSVQNLPDGSVEIYAQGGKEALESLLFYLREEAFPHEIVSVEAQYSSPRRRYHHFEII